MFPYSSHQIPNWATTSSLALFALCEGDAAFEFSSSRSMLPSIVFSPSTAFAFLDCCFNLNGRRAHLEFALTWTVTSKRSTHASRTWRRDDVRPLYLANNLFMICIRPLALLNSLLAFVLGSTLDSHSNFSSTRLLVDARFVPRFDSDSSLLHLTWLTFTLITAFPFLFRFLHFRFFFFFVIFVSHFKLTTNKKKSS